MTRICGERNVALIKPPDLTILLHLTQDRADGVVVLLQRFSDLSWTHPVWLLLTEQVEDLLASSRPSDFIRVSDQCPQRCRRVKTHGQVLLAFDIAPSDVQQCLHLAALAR